MRSDRLQVVFHLPGAVAEIRFLDRLPELDELVELRGQRWRVVHVERHPRAARYDALCDEPPSRRLRDLADDLLRRVRGRSVERTPW